MFAMQLDFKYIVEKFRGKYLNVENNREIKVKRG